MKLCPLTLAIKEVTERSEQWFFSRAIEVASIQSLGVLRRGSKNNLD